MTTRCTEQGSKTSHIETRARMRKKRPTTISIITAFLAFTRSKDIKEDESNKTSLDFARAPTHEVGKRSKSSLSLYLAYFS